MTDINIIKAKFDSFAHHAIEVTKEKYNDMLNVLACHYIDTIDGWNVEEAFAVSEPIKDEKGKPTFSTYFIITENGIHKFYKLECWIEKTTFANYNEREFSTKNIAHSVEPYIENKRK